jgi:hypothetical protein
MRTEEFQGWLKYHFAAFPEFKKWWMKGDEDEQQVRLEQWMKALSGCSPDGCRSATDAMLAGDIEQPRAYSAHPSAIRLHAKGTEYEDRSPKFTVEGERVYRCSVCRDTGIVNVIDPRYSKRGIYRDCGAACSCSSGRRWIVGMIKSDGTRTAPVIKYDESRMFRVPDGIGDADIAAFEQWRAGSASVPVEEDLADQQMALGF